MDNITWPLSLSPFERAYKRIQGTKNCLGEDGSNNIMGF